MVSPFYLQRNAPQQSWEPFNLPRIAQCGSLTQQIKNLFCGIRARICSLFSVDVYYILLPCDCILTVCGYLTTLAVFTSTALGGIALTAGLDAHDFVFCCCPLPNVSSP